MSMYATELRGRLTGIKCLSDAGLNGQKTEKWIDTDEAMKLLGIKSATTLQRYRDEGRFRFSQKDRRIIKYDRFSINEYLKKNVKDTF